ncbi:MAG TPA: selenocysteine-specific translation elongation factor [Candidatus Sumerlaeota bacterium]|nr:MAG: Selenocysteine-specific elongation factor [candidate division BRC1 bacterium ADurb.Bin183]HOE62426.1 selenocysteine-specific translation elongation factor [Candidatus Sumerlaeota bacterium]HRR30773.1 selenocysteine-specific translation elongation factor [Candidatus Sumerlaeia bacterium]HON50133.1 selenocysteine-specific translation elongation factor [Candidatus Sumerlaeota bacterium]HOR63349.1 selenocysteine-specific translation elongation factor [Candidatus Sumerlaeota bacterium]
MDKKTLSPGFLKPSVNPEVVMMLCTAGHVDHGKTALVNLLTGCNTDRLKIEQERGMTIELGFAPCFLGGNLCAGIVDVPGHEKFIKNMVAGVSGIQMTILVIAADDGIMPQTVEHLQIMELLGVRRGMAVLTKIDLVSPEQVKRRQTEIAEFLKGTFLQDAPICPVSSVTYEGYVSFYQTLIAMIQKISMVKRRGIFRMPIERVFVRSGFGVIVSGIPVDGAIRVGDEIEASPGNIKGRVRGIQRFLRDSEEGYAGQCLALNIPDFSRHTPARGQVICRPGYLVPSSIFHLQIIPVPGFEHSFKNSEEIKFHTGTGEHTGKLYLLGEEELSEGRARFGTVVLREPIAAAAGDRFIIRRSSPAITIAGGEILVASREQKRPRKTLLIEGLKHRISFFAGCAVDSDETQTRRVEFFLLTDKKDASSLSEISTGLLLPEENVRESLKSLLTSEKVMEIGTDLFIHRKIYLNCVEELARRAEQAGSASDAISFKDGELRKGLSWREPLWQKIEREPEIMRLIERRGNQYILQEKSAKLRDAESKPLSQILQIYEETGFESPRPDILSERLSLPLAKVEKLIEHLCHEKKLVRLDRKVILSYHHFNYAQNEVIRIIKEKGVLNSGDFKNVIRSSRKYALAILDYLDSIGVTMRIGSDRKLAPDYVKRIL